MEARLKPSCLPFRGAQLLGQFSSLQDQEPNFITSARHELVLGNQNHKGPDTVTTMSTFSCTIINITAKTRRLRSVVLSLRRLHRKSNYYQRDNVQGFRVGRDACACWWVVWEPAAPRLTGGVVFRQILTWVILVSISCSPLSFLLEKPQARYKITKRAKLSYQFGRHSGSSTHPIHQLAFTEHLGTRFCVKNWE